MNYIKILKNRYVLTLVLFLGWMVFLDVNNVFSQYKMRSILSQKVELKEYLIKEIKVINEEMLDLTTNPQTLEKFAREKYLMKKENEVIFVIMDDEVSYANKINKAVLLPL
ncbi:MAG: septum formation initiator family protein [Flavobacteriales bacterium]|nr:septum formation initiator family protein [Flavobacteriales bacterium]